MKNLLPAVLCIGTLAGWAAEPERKILDVTVGRATERIGYWTVDSGKPGPVLAVIAEQHGNELNGSVAVRDFLRRVAQEGLLKGRVIGVPFANPPAARHRLPMVDLSPAQPYIQSVHNMQTLWSEPPRNDTGFLADGLWKGLLHEADYIVDLHCYPKFMAPVAWYPDTPEGRRIGRASGFRFARMTPADGGSWKGSVRVRALKEGKTPLGIELCGQYEITDAEVKRGVRVLANVAKELGMLTGEKEFPEGETVQLGPAQTVYSPGAGVFVKSAALKPGDRVEKGQSLGYLLCETTLEEIPVVAPCTGYLMRYAGRPDGDVDLRDHSQYLFLDDLVAVIAETK